MKPVQLALELKRILSSGKYAYVRCLPECLDFTDPVANANLVIYPKSGEPLKVPLNKETLVDFLGILNAAIFEDKDFVVFCWDIKPFFSYIKYYTKSLNAFACKMFDIKLIEAYLGKREKAPNDFGEASVRVKAMIADDSYENAKLIYNKIHIPLFSEIIPSIETNGLYNKNTRIALYPSYEIEGQRGGRMKCHEAFKHSFVPHTLGPEQREILYPRGMDEVFVYFDYRNMEVSTLQWLSNDDHVLQMLELEEDFYKVFFKLISGSVCDNERKRETSKKIFLPVIYGMQAETMASELGISYETADKIIGKVYKLFPKSLNWIQQKFDGVCRDHFGRKRYYDGSTYKARNFLVQAPASNVCLEKLIALFRAIDGRAKLVCHIHDGYVVTCSRSSLKMVVSIGRDVLLGESELCPGLKLKVSVKSGSTLEEAKKGAELNELN